jgi:hypothetical protein
MSPAIRGFAASNKESRVTGHRHGHRSRSLLGTFGRVEIAVPRARLATAEGKTTEWKSTALRAYQRRTQQADALIAGAYLAGTNTRRVRRALSAVFGGAVGKDTVSRVWRKVKGDWDAWNARSLAEEPIIRVILDGTVVRVRLDRKATSIVLLVVLGVREDGQKVLLAVKNMGGETSEAWRAVLDDLVKRGLRKPEFLIVDGGSGLEQALAALWGDVPTQRCTVHKHRNLLSLGFGGGGMVASTAWIAATSGWRPSRRGGLCSRGFGHAARPGMGQHVPFSGLVQAHTPGESRAFAPVAMDGTAETDSPAERERFEPSVPREFNHGCSTRRVIGGTAASAGHALIR